MKKVYVFISLLLVCSLLIGGCGKIDSKDTADSKEKQTTDVSETPVPMETPTPKEATISKKKGYSDANREVSILGLKEYKKIKTEDYTDKAPTGKKYLVLFLKVKNLSVNKDYFNVDYLTAEADGKEIQNTFLFNDPEGYSTIFQNIEAGSTLGGFIVWEVPQNWKKLSVSYEGWKDSHGLTLKCTLTPKDLKEPPKYDENAFY